MAANRISAESAACMIITGAKDPRQYQDLGEREKQQRLLQSIARDVHAIVSFGAKHSRVNRRDGFVHPVRISNIMHNASSEHALHEAVGRASSRSPASHQHLLGQALVETYEEKDTVRTSVRNFFAYSPEKYLILVLLGHGDQRRAHGQHVSEGFIIPTIPGYHDQIYTDNNLTEDINSSLPEGKTLYLVIHACHSGGMLNLWSLDYAQKSVALFASAEAKILSEWNDDEVQGGFIKSFCTHAQAGDKLMTIAERILEDNVSIARKIRPAFITTRPSMAGDAFLR